MLGHLTAFGDSADDAVELDIVGVVGLDVGCEAVEGALDGFFGGGVHHAWVLRRIIRAPRDEGNLVSSALTALKLILHIKHGITATNALLTLPVLRLGVEQLLAEIGPFALGAGLLNHDFLPVVADLVDDPFHGLAKFELVEGRNAFGCDGDSLGSHGEREKKKAVGDFAGRRFGIVFLLGILEGL